MRSSVDLPEPDGPKTTTCSPGDTTRSTPHSTSFGPEALADRREPHCVGHVVTRAESTRRRRSTAPSRPGGRSPHARFASEDAERDAEVVGRHGAERGARRRRHAVLDEVERGQPAVGTRGERHHLVERAAPVDGVEPAVGRAARSPGRAGTGTIASLWPRRCPAGPSSAASAACWLTAEMHDSIGSWIVPSSWASGRGHAAYPTRQPVIE